MDALWFQSFLHNKTRAWPPPSPPMSHTTYTLLLRLVPTTWVIYGLGISQLDSTTTMIRYNGQVTTLRAFMEQFFGYVPSMQWWCLLIMVAHIVFLRVVSVLALAYARFLRR
jgi:hypothetical protein